MNNYENNKQVEDITTLLAEEGMVESLNQELEADDSESEESGLLDTVADMAKDKLLGSGEQDDGYNEGVNDGELEEGSRSDKVDEAREKARQPSEDETYTETLRLEVEEVNTKMNTVNDKYQQGMRNLESNYNKVMAEINDPDLAAMAEINPESYQRRMSALQDQANRMVQAGQQAQASMSQQVGHAQHTLANNDMRARIPSWKSEKTMRRDTAILTSALVNDGYSHEEIGQVAASPKLTLDAYQKYIKAVPERKTRSVQRPTKPAAKKAAKAPKRSYQGKGQLEKGQAVSNLLSDLGLL